MAPMVIWSTGLTVALAALLILLGWLLGVRSPGYRAVFFLALALWQSALTVAIYTRNGVKSRADCLGVGTISVLATVIYVLARYSQSWKAIVVGSPGIVAVALGGAWLAWRAAKARQPIANRPFRPE